MRVEGVGSQSRPGAMITLHHCYVVKKVYKNKNKKKYTEHDVAYYTGNAVSRSIQGPKLEQAEIGAR